MAESRARRDRGEGVARSRRCRGEAKESLAKSERRLKPRPTRRDGEVRSVRGRVEGKARPGIVQARQGMA